MALYAWVLMYSKGTCGVQQGNMWSTAGEHVGYSRWWCYTNKVPLRSFHSTTPPHKIASGPHPHHLMPYSSLAIQGNSTKPTTNKISPSPHLHPHHTSFLTTPPSSPHLLPHHTSSLTTPPPSPHLHPHHTSILTTPPPSPHLLPHHTSSLTTPPPSPSTLLSLTPLTFLCLLMARSLERMALYFW